ncbi:3-hydroxyacyl-CoA dehydrogenase [Lichenicoccus roseus]|uniref:3-hydroxyacyl-CoA dehydrogenase n=1 Tax=Lichenicoccus roseus TaxID=2683649 RepID=A0A5R9J1V0_9PROT|nr:3-hydroxyacyl-CoA dehydrogenase [Lichenicoccus roseus]TLU70949.1 3-hydroxyacyl-CoA dehydrogenase [Lichenicoccus roseus]
MAPGNIGIVGAGLVGLGWAIVFARAGHAVRLYDNAPGAAAEARRTIALRLDDLRQAGLIDEAPATILARVSVADSLAEALEDALYVQESVLERVDVKNSVMREIDALVGPATWIGSSSSGLPASLYTEGLGCRDRCLVAHPVNPPYLAPIVELVPAPWTSPATLDSVRTLMQAVGQAPVTMSQEAPGFILNRLQAVLLMEAWRLVEAGLASVADVDLTVSQGLGLRWAFMGPFETIDLNAPGGIADYARRLGGLYRDIAAETTEQRGWDNELIARIEAQRREVLPEAELVARSAWRDRRLMALALHKRRMDSADAAGTDPAATPGTQ